MTPETGTAGMWLRCDVPGADHPPPVRPYACGPRCTRHTPAAMAGQPEAPEPTRKDQP